MLRSKTLMAAAIALLLLALLVSGCGWLWPRENPRDPARCDPSCPTGLVCVDGLCKLGDGGLPFEAGLDGAPPVDLPAPDLPPADQDPE